MLLKLIAACALCLALPSSAMAAITLEGPASVGEADGVATYTVTCGGGPLDAPVTVSTADGPAPEATAGEDYTPLPTLPPTTAPCALLIPSEHTFEVPIINDGDDEGNEKFTVSIGSLPPQSIETTIVDDDPIASITPVVLVTEGTDSTASLEIKLSSSPISSTTIGFATEDLTAKAGADYTETSGNLVFAVGQTSKTISIPILDDTDFEEPEAFFVNLTSITSTTHGSLSPTAKQGAVGIFDNETAPVPAASITREVSVKEGNRGTVNALFTVSLSSPAGGRIEVPWRTIDWTAQSNDYESDRGRVVFQAGQRTKSISVNVIGDRRDEPDEAFGVVLENPVGATLGAIRGGFGIIVDDDGPELKIGKPKPRKRAIVTRLRCPETASRCRGVARAKAGKLKLGKARFDMQKGSSTKVRTRISRKARRALERRSLRAKMIVKVSDASGDTRKVKRKFRIRRR